MVRYVTRRSIMNMVRVMSELVVRGRMMVFIVDMFVSIIRVVLVMVMRTWMVSMVDMVVGYWRVLMIL